MAGRHQGRPDHAHEKHPDRGQADRRAVALIQLGARLQVLVIGTDLSYERLLRLYKEVAGKSRARASCPFRPTGS